MLRDKNLVPLSRQHQHALALCVRISRAIDEDAVDLDAWQAEIVQQFEDEMAGHFAAEEKDIFPQAARLPELQGLVQELLAEHEILRKLFSQAGARELDALGLAEVAERLSGHIRKEERQLFETMQRSLSAEQLQHIGQELQAVLPPSACRLR